jgi:hypothetical protein
MVDASIDLKGELLGLLQNGRAVMLAKLDGEPKYGLVQAAAETFRSSGNDTW